MRNDVKIDARSIKCPNARGDGFNRRVAQRGDCILYKEKGVDGWSSSGVRLGRVLGRVSAPIRSGQGGDGAEVDGFALVMAMSDDHRSVFERWVDPKDIEQVFFPSPALAAFFNAPEVSVDVRKHLSNGEISEGNLRVERDGSIQVVVSGSGKPVMIGNDGRGSAAEDLRDVARKVLDVTQPVLNLMRTLAANGEGQTVSEASVKLWLERAQELSVAAHDLSDAVARFEAPQKQPVRAIKRAFGGGESYIQWVNFKNQIHRDDGPAVEWDSGSKEWYFEGKHHRDGGPAIERVNGQRWWYRHGEIHREGGPAVEYPNGSREWQIDGMLHREDGPAVEYFSDEQRVINKERADRIEELLAREKELSELDPPQELDHSDAAELAELQESARVPSGTFRWFLYGREIEPEQFAEAVRNKEVIAARVAHEWMREGLAPMSADEIAVCEQAIKREIERAKGLGLSKGRLDDYRSADENAAFLCRSEAEMQALSKNLGMDPRDARIFDDGKGGKVWTLGYKYEVNPYLTAWGVFKEVSLFADRKRGVQTVKEGNAVSEEVEEDEQTQGISR